MVALLIGFVLIAFTVVACVPQALGWGQEILLFLKGCAPVLAGFIGLIAVFVGIADIKDRNEAKKEEEAAKSSEEKEEK